MMKKIINKIAIALMIVMIVFNVFVPRNIISGVENVATTSYQNTNKQPIPVTEEKEILDLAGVSESSEATENSKEDFVFDVPGLKDVNLSSYSEKINKSTTEAPNFLQKKHTDEHELEFERKLYSAITHTKQFDTHDVNHSNYLNLDYSYYPYSGQARTFQVYGKQSFEVRYINNYFVNGALPVSISTTFKKKGFTFPVFQDVLEINLMDVIVSKASQLSKNDEVTHLNIIGMTMTSLVIKHNGGYLYQHEFTMNWSYSYETPTDHKVEFEKYDVEKGYFDSLTENILTNDLKQIDTDYEWRNNNVYTTEGHLQLGSIDTDKKTMIVYFRIILNDKNFYKKMTLDIPAVEANDIPLFQLSRESSQEWDWSSGVRQYWTKSSRPKIEYIWNQDIIKALRFYHDKEFVLDKIKNIPWKDSSHSDLATAAASGTSKISDDNFLINIDTVDEFIDSYNSSENTEWFDLKNLKQPSWVKYLIDGDIVENDINTLAMNIHKSGSLEFNATNLATGFSKKIVIDNILSKSSFEFEIDDDFINDSVNQTGGTASTWSIKIDSFKFVNTNDSFSVYPILSESQYNYQDKYGINIEEVNDSQQFKFRFQPNPVSINEDISWNTLSESNNFSMNDKFIKLNSNDMPIGDGKNQDDYGWSAAYYPWNIETNQEDEGAKLFVTLKDDKWYRTSTTDKSFSEWQLLTDYISDGSVDFDKISYIFNTELQLIINPYNLSGPPSPELIASSDAKYGIKQVSNQMNQSTVILEDWEDGGLNHITDAGGLPLIDGIFGTDVNGLIDTFSIFEDGQHNVEVELYHFVAEMATNFNFEIDTSMPTISVSDSTSDVSKSLYTYMDTSENKLVSKDIYLADKPIDFIIEEENLKSVEMSFNDSSGNWFTIPHSLKMKKSGSSWVYYVHIVFNYQGFIRFTVNDIVGNTDHFFAYLKVDSNYMGIQNAATYDNNTIGEPLGTTTFDDYNSSKIETYNTNAEKIFFLDSDPTHTNVKIDKLEGYQTNAIENSDFDSVWTNHEPLSKTETLQNVSKMYQEYYGRPVPESGNSNNDLNLLVGDELKPFLKDFNSTTSVVENTTSGWYLESGELYKVGFTSLIEGIDSSWYYLWVKEENGVVSVTEVIDVWGTYDPSDIFSNEGVIGQDKLRIDIDVTDERKEELIASRDNNIKLEKEIWLLNYDWQNARATYDLYLEDSNSEYYEDQITDLLKLVDKHGNQTSFGEYMVIKKSYDSALEKHESKLLAREQALKELWISAGNNSNDWEESKHDDDILISDSEWLNLHVDYAEWSNNEDVMNSVWQISLFENNLESDLEFHNKTLAQIESDSNELDLIWKELKQKYDSKNEEYILGIMSLNTTEQIEVDSKIILFEEVKIANGNTVVKSPIIPIWEIIKLNATIEIKRIQNGYINQFDVKQDANILSPSAYGQTMVMKITHNNIETISAATLLYKTSSDVYVKRVEIDDNGNKVYVDTLVAEIGDVFTNNFISADNEKEVIYSGEMVWNGAEFQDKVHWEMWNEKWVGENLELDPMKVWEMKESANRENAVGGKPVISPDYENPLEEVFENLDKQESNTSQIIAAAILSFIFVITSFVLLVRRFKTKKII